MGRTFFAAVQTILDGTLAIKSADILNTLQIYLSWWGLNCFRPKTFDF